jgi:hypothetical protein
MDGENGQTGEKNYSRTFILTAIISFGLFNVFPKSDPISQSVMCEKHSYHSQVVIHN